MENTYEKIDVEITAGNNERFDLTGSYVGKLEYVGTSDLTIDIQDIDNVVFAGIENGKLVVRFKGN